MVDQPGAIPMWVPENITFSYTDATWLVLHKTAGFQTAQDCAAYFQSGSGGNNVSSHYIVGLDGTIVQCVPESRGAGANCCPTAGHASYLPTDINLNLKTIAIEHIDPASDNSTPMPEAQKAASFQLVHDICVRHNIPMRGGDASGGIIGHKDIDPINRARCPGNYAWDELWAYLNNGGEHVGIPANWKDDGTTLTAPNNVPVVKGFRGYILNNPWDSANWPVEAEHGANPLELSNPALGGGTQQRFRMTTLEWTSARGVFVAWTGPEMLALEQKVQALTQQLQSTQNANVEQLQQQLDAANKQLSAKNTALAQIATEATAATK